MSLDKAMKNLKFDKRLTEWNLNNGHLTNDELKDHLTKLPDVSANVEMLNLDESDDHDILEEAH